MRLLLASVVSAVCCYSGLYGMGSEYVQLTEGSITFTLQPTGTAGTAGTWQPCIITPAGEYIEGPVVAFDDATPAQFSINCGANDFVELGCYAVELKNNVTGAVDASIVSSIQVTANCPYTYAPWDTITYKQIAPSSDGEKTLVYYVLPGMEPVD